MRLDVDDEILQDFLVEAGELLDGLNEQLVELEQNPEDRDLLNAVFRGFHTIKGGAGFLNLTSLVTVCHRAEDVFNLLRQGQREVDGTLMDAVLQVLDVVGRMFDEVRSGQEPAAADPALIAALEALAVPGGAETPPAPAPAPAQPEVRAAAAGSAEPPDAAPVEQTASAAQGGASGAGAQGAEATAASGLGGAEEISDEEFERLLDAMHGEGRGPTSGATETPEASAAADAAGGAGVGSDAPAGGAEISDDEFERLLDSMHGKGRGPTSSAPAEAATPQTGAGGGAEISDDEFERLLDSMHGKGRGPTSSAAAPAASAAGSAGGSAGGEPAPQGAAPPSPPPARESAAPAAKAPAAAAPAGEASAPRKAATTDPSVRVDTRRLDDIMNLVGELVLVRNRLANLRTNVHDEDLGRAVSNLDAVTSDLQAAVMKTRMQPIKKVFGRFPRVVRDLARSIHKEIELELQGEETDLDKNLVEALADPLVHLVRNAVDHGIEGPDERERVGKPRAGRVVLAAAQEGDHILLTISDDGRGMDPEVFRRKAVEKGLMDADSAARMSDRNALNLIFAAGFSTKSEISDISGRGVGMDVVKTRIAQLNGMVEIDSEVGRGSVLQIKVPLTLAIMPTLMVVVGRQRFALPLSNVSEILELDHSQVHQVDGQDILMVREHALPIHDLRDWLAIGPRVETGRDDDLHVVVVMVGTRRAGLVVEQLLGQEEVVIKPLGSYLQGLPGFAGATITGDGGIALILDVPGLIRSHARGVGSAMSC